ncbi:MAG TPA: hypothetical protein VGH30_01750 [Jatrophihabitantaceae bacterium]|jgi:hypothetical protein
MTSTMPMYPVQQQPLPNQPVPTQPAQSTAGATRGVALVAALAIAGGVYYATHQQNETVPGHGHGRATVDTSGWAAPLAAFTPLIGSKPHASDAWSSAQCAPVPSSDSSVVTNIACTEPDESTINVVVFRSASVVDRIVQSSGEQGDDIHAWSHDGGASLGDVITRSTGRPYVATTFDKYPTVIVEVSGLPDVGPLTSDWQALPLPQ